LKPFVIVSSDIYYTNFGTDVLFYSYNNYSTIKVGIHINRGWEFYVLRILPPIGKLMILSTIMTDSPNLE
jgi:hypothetical protein